MRLSDRMFGKKTSKRKTEPSSVVFFVLLAAVIVVRFAYVLLMALAAVGLAAAMYFGSLYGYRFHKKRQKQQQLSESGIFDIDVMSGKDFENFLETFFIGQGCSVERTPTTGDFGADLIIGKDGLRTAIQVKRQSSNVGVSAVQEVVAARAHYVCDDAWIVTNAFFTGAARALARSNDVDLWDRAILVETLLDENRSLTLRT